MKSILFILSIFLLLFSCKGGTQKTNDNSKNSNEFIEKYGQSEFTALGLACLKGDLEKVKELIENGADMDYAMSDELFIVDALHVAVSYGHADIVEYLLKQGAETERDYSLLSMACLNNNIDVSYKIARLLIDAGAGINGYPDVNGHPDIPLHHAVANNNVALAKFLIDKGADINLKNERGETIFIIAEYCDEPMKEYIKALETNADGFDEYNEKYLEEMQKVVTEENKCELNNLSENFGFSFVASGNDSNRPDVTISITDKKSGIVQKIDYAPDFLFAFNLCNAISYFNNSDKVSEGLEEYHQFIIGDYNFDGLEDFAIINYEGGNGGPIFMYYFQNNEGNFITDGNFPFNRSFFPNEINEQDKTLTERRPAGAVRIVTRIYQLNNNKWSMIVDEVKELQKNTEE